MQIIDEHGTPTPVEQPAIVDSITKEAENALYEVKEPVTEVVEEEVAAEVTPVSEEANKPEVAETEVKEGETTEDETSEPEVEIEYKLALGKESLLDGAVVESVTAFAKEHKLSNEVAQEVLNRQESVISDFINAEAQKHDSELDGWRDTVVNDEVMGGNNLKKTAEDAKRVVERFGSDGFIEILRDTGYGDHPDVVRFLSTLGGLMSEDSLILGNIGGQDKSTEELLYGPN